jgi:hypothetical protein
MAAYETFAAAAETDALKVVLEGEHAYKLTPKDEFVTVA